MLVFVLCEHSRLTVETENLTEFLTFEDNGFEEEMHVGEIACLLMQPDRRLGVIIVFGSSVGVYIYRMKFHLAQIKNRDIVSCT